MFGTLKPYLNIFTKSQKSIFKTHYCGLCNELASYKTPFLRFLLSYDIAMAYMLFSSEDEYSFARCYCPAKLFCSRRCVKRNELSRFFTDISLILSYEKLADNIRDKEHIWLSKLGILWLRKNYNNIFEKRKSVCLDINDNLNEFYLMENSENPHQIEECADKFGCILGNILKNVPGFSMEEDVYYNIGYWIGRWIYVSDAAFDYKKDIIKHRFNPLCHENTATLLEIISSELFKSHDNLLDTIRLTDIYNKDDILHMFDVSMNYTEGYIFKVFGGENDKS